MISLLFGLIISTGVVYFDESHFAKMRLPRIMFSSLLKWKSINVLISLGGVLVFKADIPAMKDIKLLY